MVFHAHCVRLRLYALRSYLCYTALRLVIFKREKRFRRYDSIKDIVPGNFATFCTKLKSIYKQVATKSVSGALFGDPLGSPRQKVIISTVTQAQILDAEWSTNTFAKLGLALLPTSFLKY